MARKKITLHKFDGGASDDQRVQSVRQVWENDGFDLLNNVDSLKPMKDWVFQVDYDSESNIDWSTSSETSVFAYGSNHYTMTEDGSGNARPVKIDGLLSSSVTVTDPTTAVIGTPQGLRAGGEFLFRDRLWFVESTNNIGYYDLSIDEILHTEYSPNGSYVRKVPPILSPDRKSILWAFGNRVHEITYNPAADTYSFSDSVLVTSDDITSLAVKGTRVMVATYSDTDGSHVSPWQILEEDVDTSYYVSHDPVYAMAEEGGAFVAVTAKSEDAIGINREDGSIEVFFLKGSGFEKYREFSEPETGTDSSQGMRLTKLRGKVYFTGEQNVYGVGSRNSDYPTIVTKMASLKLDSSKYSGSQESDDHKIHRLFEAGGKVCVIGEFHTSSETKRGIFVMDADNDYYMRANVVTQKYRFGDIGETSQLVEVNLTLDSTSPSGSDFAVFPRVDDVSKAAAVASDGGYENLINKSKRHINGTNFDIGNEFYFDIKSYDGAEITEFSLELAPRMTKFNQYDG